MKVQEARKLTTEQKIKALKEGRARLAEGHGGRYALVILEDERPQKAGVTRALESVRVLKAEAVEIFKAFGLPPNTRVCPPPTPSHDRRTHLEGERDYFKTKRAVATNPAAQADLDTIIKYIESLIESLPNQ